MTTLKELRARTTFRDEDGERHFIEPEEIDPAIAARGVDMFWRAVEECLDSKENKKGKQ